MPKSPRQASLPGMDDESRVAASVEPSRESGKLAAQQQAISADRAENNASPFGPEWTVYAIDSHSLIFQVFHAMHGSDLTSPQGEPVGAVYGFARDMLQLLERKSPTALVCAFDLPGPTFRHDMYDKYKADRSEMPDELRSQIPKIRELVNAMGIPVLDSAGFEADDVLATLARLCDEAGAKCSIVTGDKDCRQLITDNVSVYNIRKDQDYTAVELFGDWGIRPDQVVDFQALVGDKVDNVPGVPLIGPKIAMELLERFGTVEEVLDHASEVSGKKRSQNLIDFREDALISRKLVELDVNVPITPDWQACRVGGFDLEKLDSLFREHGFRGLGDRIKMLGNQFQSVGSTTAAPPASAWEADYHLVDTLEGLQQLVEQLSQQTTISVDTETTSVQPREAEIVGYSFAWQSGVAYYVAVRGPEGSQVIDPAKAAELLKPVLENPTIGKIGQNLKYDIVVLKNAGIQLAGVEFDTMVASYLLEAGERGYNLDLLAQRYLGHATSKIEDLIGKGKNQRRMDEAPVAEVSDYAAEDADVPLRLLPILQARLEEDNLVELNETLETPLIEVLAQIEFEGVCVDVERLAELSKTYTARLERLALEIEEMAGHPLNIASPKQLSEVLFTELGLPVIKKTKTGASTDASVLEELASQHPLPAKIVEYRQYSKLLGTYIDALPKLVHPTTGRVHASLNQVVAATGRLSSSNPNLQNIPIRTAEGREIRSAFRAGQPGWQLLAADYSQIELRVLAHFCSDLTLSDAFAADEDIHRLVASQVNGVTLDEVTTDMRRAAKAVNFGIIYGQSPFGLAKALDISKEAAADFIETYFASYPGVLDFFVDTLTECRNKGYVTTLLGRRRAVSGIRPVPEGLREPKNGQLRQLNLPERTAVNTVIQGSAADLIKLAMLAVHRRLKEEPLEARMILQIHDELLFEVAPDSIEPLVKLVDEEMTNVMALDVPLKVDVKVGPNWAECEGV
ncbi:DNA polymerase I [Adhaeretor mobilis]|uniref:DNA polymerase I n=1 Tax=Adhaeretor mobilis TaxID=1930276 RepID=A0A517MXR8_9BACT|nr:DNA polymerase I [Adhaeretor mobilis]QDS99675.1 DNA polymerase I [Adhaeretor mobilis]